ncbi:MAG TPA: sigma-70 family RNA polymerase sigma factor [Acidimicrobiia bacterium]|nr:sigma-70 family RNA polymerase sigma factor [Acidimicrobiia bacterium]
MTRPGNEAELLTRVVSGDRAAFDAIMRLHEDRVFSVCLRVLRDREGALDATQDTFLTVFRKANQFQGRSALGTWIYRIAVNTCYDHLRRSGRRPTQPLPEHVDPSDPSAEEAIDSAALRPEIESALALIPTDFRDAVILSDLEGLTMPEAAEVLGVPIGTVKSRVFRGRRLLAELLGNQYDP